MKALLPLAVALLAAPLLAPRALAGTTGGVRDGEVRGVSVRAASGKVEVVIDLQGAAVVQDFTLSNPARLVIDLQGARLTGRVTLYDGQNRGGIRNVRYGQFKPDVVRVVIDLDALKDYRVERAAGQVRVRIGTERTGFAAWSSNTVAPPAAVAAAPRRTVERTASSEAPAPPVTGRPESAARARRLHGPDHDPPGAYQLREGDVIGPIGRLDPHKARRRRGGLDEQLTRDHRGQLAYRGSRRVREGPRPAHAAGVDPGQDHLCRPHRRRGARRQVRPRLDDAVLQQAHSASRSAHRQTGRHEPGRRPGRARAAGQLPGEPEHRFPGRQLAVRARQRGAGGREPGA